MKRFTLLVGLCALFLVFHAAFAADWRFGGEVANVSASPETNSVQTFVPSLYLGFPIDRGYSIFGELAGVDYTTTMTGDRSTKTLSTGSLDIEGGGILLGLLKSQPLSEKSAIEGRFGIGLMYFIVHERLAAAVTNLATAFGATYDENVGSDNALQAAAGLDYVMSDGLRLGIEFRQLNFEPKVTAKLSQNGQTAKASGTAVLSTTWSAFRIQFPL